MKRPLLKICGIMREADVALCCRAGVDICGFVTEYPVPVPWNLRRERCAELLASLDAPAYLERVAVNSVAHVRQAKKAIHKAFKNQVEGRGFSLVEVVSTCPTNWGLTPEKACQWVAEKMIPFYPLGVYRDKDADAAKEAAK